MTGDEDHAAVDAVVVEERCGSPIPPKTSSPTESDRPTPREGGDENFR